MVLDGVIPAVYIAEMRLLTTIRPGKALIIFLASLVANTFAYGPRFPAGMVKSIDDFSSPNKPKDGSEPWDSVFQYAVTNQLGGSRFLYLPNGTYLLNAPILWKTAQDAGDNCSDGRVWDAGLHLLGESRDGVIIKLQSGASGFGNPSNPLPLFQTGSALKNCEMGVADNSGFWNSFSNLTIDLGSNNPGAVGIRYVANNVGAIRNLRIKAASEAYARAGIDAAITQPGPLYIKDITIENTIYGLEYGERLTQPAQMVAVENANFKNQSEAAIWNVGGVIGIRKVVAEGQKCFLNNMNTGNYPYPGFVTVMEGRLFGSNTTQPAIVSNGMLNVRGTSARGFPSLLQEENAVYPTRILSDFVSAAYPGGQFTGTPPASPIIRLPGALETSMNLPVESTPEFPESDFTTWAVVETDAQCVGSFVNCMLLDHTSRINEALQGTAANVLLKPGYYTVSAPLVVGPNVRRIIGNGAYISLKQRQPGDNLNLPTSLFTIPSSISHDVFIDNLDIGAATEGNYPELTIFRHESTGRLILTNLYLRTLGRLSSPTIKGAYSCASNAGSLFIENVSSSSSYTTWIFRPGQKIWARQFNLEGERVNVINNGATFWVFGVKSENKNTIVRNQSGGKTELLAGIFYEDGDAAITEPLFDNINSSLSAGFMIWPGYGGGYYTTVVREEGPGGSVSSLSRSQLWLRLNRAFSPLYSGVRSYSGGERGCWATTWGAEDAIRCLMK